MYPGYTYPPYPPGHAPTVEQSSKEASNKKGKETVKRGKSKKDESEEEEETVAVRRRFSDEEEAALTDIVGPMWAANQGSNTLWPEVQKQMKARGFDRSPDSLINKWADLRKTYGIITVHNKKTGSSPFFSLSAKQQKDIVERNGDGEVGGQTGQKKAKVISEARYDQLHEHLYSDKSYHPPVLGAMGSANGVTDGQGQALRETTFLVVQCLLLNLCRSGRPTSSASLNEGNI